MAGANAEPSGPNCKNGAMLSPFIAPESPTTSTGSAAPSLASDTGTGTGTGASPAPGPTPGRNR
ncbi:hypothetical protein GCM10009839_62600 [Catenulispora yoronensis]|uniref:Uncharacterized protein n=1 Tax=Catenulispora yoronensis TaxID=450799 RepID=A0ABP5GJS8_9ACTN